MKVLKKLSQYVLMTIMVMGFIWGFSSCSENMPVKPKLCQEGPGFDVSMTPLNQDEIEFLDFGKPGRSLGKSTGVLMEVTKPVTENGGGTLKLVYNGDNHDNGHLKAKTTLKVPSEAIETKKEFLTLSMFESICSGDVEIEFSPDGIRFKKDALLNFELENVDLSNLGTTNLAFYYVNLDTGLWEKMIVEQIIVNIEEGYIKIVNAHIPHFSRYALSKGGG